jgi:hypothetical protein
MKKFTVFVLVCAFALSACLPAAAPVNSAPTVDIAGTVNAIANTAIALTQTAQPSPTATPVQITATPTLEEPSATSTTIPNTDTPQPNLTTTPATATSGAAVNPTATFTPTLVPGLPSLTPTLGVLTYGTLPPANRPYVYITLINKAQRQAYISLQVVTDQGYTIIEYPVKGTVKVKIPTGSYTYVLWVGGRQIVGYFNVSKHDEPTLLIYKDKVIINKNTSSYP